MSKRSIKRDSIAIKASGALECRAAGVIEKLGALATLPFTTEPCLPRELVGI